MIEYKFPPLTGKWLPRPDFDPAATTETNDMRIYALGDIRYIPRSDYEEIKESLITEDSSLIWYKYNKIQMRKKNKIPEYYSNHCVNCRECFSSKDDFQIHYCVANKVAQDDTFPQVRTTQSRFSTADLDKMQEEANSNPPPPAPPKPVEAPEIRVIQEGFSKKELIWGLIAIALFSILTGILWEFGLYE